MQPADSRDDLLRLPDADLLGRCRIDRFRGSGPGGQKRNKTDSAVRLRHLPTGIAVTAAESRSQHENRARALARMREAIALAVRASPPRDRLAPALASLVDGGLVPPGPSGRRRPHYLVAVAQLLDLFCAHGCALADTAQALGVSTAHLVRFAARDARLWRRLGELRAARGLRPLQS